MITFIAALGLSVATPAPGPHSVRKADYYAIEAKMYRAAGKPVTLLAAKHLESLSEHYRAPVKGDLGLRGGEFHG